MIFSAKYPPNPVILVTSVITAIGYDDGGDGNPEERRQPPWAFTHQQQREVNNINKNNGAARLAPESKNTFNNKTNMNTLVPNPENHDSAEASAEASAEVSAEASAETPEGYDLVAVAAWLAEQIPALVPPFKWTRLEGGHSNLTYRLDDAKGASAVIRRPPQGQLLAGAHDMRREWAVISALKQTPVPVPEAMGFCEDTEITGAHFYVMGLIAGKPLYQAEDTVQQVPEERRSTLAHSFIDVLSDLHALDPDEIGLGDLGKKDSYVKRQLKTWYRSWNSSIVGAGFDDPRAHELQEYFLNHLPEQEKARLVHGDYGLHNCLVGADSLVAAVVDWEISTLGDPLADVAYALNQWPDPTDEIPMDPEAATTVPGFPTRTALARRYAKNTGRDLSHLDYYVGFNRWKGACILHGVYARYREGKKSTEGVDLESLRLKVEIGLTLSEQAVSRLR